MNAKTKREGEVQVLGANKEGLGTVAEEKKEVATTAPQGGTALATVDFGDDEGAGLENVGLDEQRIPIYRILHYSCPQIEVGNALYDPLAKPGMILNTATGQLYQEFDFVPVYRDHQFIEWTPVDSGGGFVGVWALDDPRLAKLKAEQGKFGALKTADGTEVVDTFYLYGLLTNLVCADGTTDEGVYRGLLTFSSTRIKYYQALMSRLNTISYPGPNGKVLKPALWSHLLHVGSKPDRNKAGAFFGWKLGLKQEPPIKSLIPRTDPLNAMAKEFHDLIKAGTVQAAYDAGAAEGAAPADGEEIPF